MVETSIAITFIGGAGFLSFIAYRLGQQANITGSETNRMFLKIGEIILYCFGALMVDILLFIIFEATSALGYTDVIRTAFLIFQILLGLVGGLGAITFIVILVILIFGKLGGKNNAVS